MVEFTHDEYKNIYIRDIIRVELDDFIVMMSATESGLAYWADGVLFMGYVMTESEALAKEEIAGTTYIDKMIFAKYPEFSRTVKSATNFEIPVVDVGRSGIYSKMIAWIKGLPAWND